MCVGIESVLFFTSSTSLKKLVFDRQFPITIPPVFSMKQKLVTLGRSYTKYEQLRQGAFLTEKFNCACLFFPLPVFFPPKATASKFFGVYSKVTLSNIIKKP